MSNLLDGLLKSHSAKSSYRMSVDTYHDTGTTLACLVVDNESVKATVKMKIKNAAIRGGVFQSLKAVVWVALSERKLKEQHYSLNDTEKLAQELKAHRVDVAVSLGEAVYALSHGNGDLNPYAFKDVFHSASYFFSPDLGCPVFPTFSMSEMVSSSWKSNHAAKQVEKAISQQWSAQFYSSAPVKKETLTTAKDVSDLFRSFKEGAWVSADIETSDLHHRTSDILNTSISLDGLTGYTLPWRIVNTDEMSEAFKRCKLIWANGKFDCKHLRYRGVECRVDFDTLAAGHLINETRSNSLKTHAYIYTREGGYDRTLDALKKQYKIASYGDLPEDILYPYAAYDAALTWQVAQHMRDELAQDERVFAYYNNLVLPAINLFVDIELQGMYVDWDKAHKAEQLLSQAMSDLDKTLVDNLVANYDIDRDSLIERRERNTLSLAEGSLQLATEVDESYTHTNRNRFSEVISQIVDFDSIPPWCLDSKGNLRTDAETLEFLGKVCPELESYSTRASLQTCYNLFLDPSGGKGLVRYKQEDGRVHPTYMVMMAESQRYRCSAPNIQQIPSGAAAGKEAILALRSMFVTPSDDFLFAEVDFAAFQLRIGAGYSGDEQLVDAFATGKDLHTLTLRNVKYPDKTYEEMMDLVKSNFEIKAERTTVGKVANFGMFFGTQPYAVHKTMIEPSWTKEQMSQYIKDHKLQMLDLDGAPSASFTVATEIHRIFFDTFKGLKNFIDGQRAFARKRGCVYSAHGARRLLPELRLAAEKDLLKDKDLKHALNISVNSPVQACEAAILTECLLEINAELRKRCLKSTLVGAVHDAFLMYVHRSEVDEIKQIILQATTRPREEMYGVPTRIEGSLADITKGEGWKNGQDWISDKESV